MIILCVYLWCAGSLSLCWPFYSSNEQGLLSGCGVQAFIVVASLVEHGLWGTWVPAVAVPQL